MEILRRLAVESTALSGLDLPDSFMLWPEVEAIGCLGRELRSVGEDFAGGLAIYACSLLLLLPEASGKRF